MPQFLVITDWMSFHSC